MVTEDVQKFFDGYASDFDHIYEKELQGGGLNFSNLFRKSMRERLDLTFALCRPLTGRSILDLGCGSGQYSLIAALEGASRVTGLDLSDEMITLARQRAHENQVEALCSFEKQNILNGEGFPSHDYCIALGVFDYIEEPAQLLQVMKAHTRLRLVASFPKKNHPLTAQRSIRYQLRGCPLYFYDKKSLQALAKDLSPLATHIFDLGRDYVLTAVSR